MGKKALLAELAKLLSVDVSALSESKKLNSFAEWDSLAVIGLVAFFDKALNRQINQNQIQNLSSISDLLQLAQVEA